MNQLLTCIDKRAPMRSKRTGNKKSPWITYELIRKRRKRDFLEKNKAERTKDQSSWADFKTAKNEAFIQLNMPNVNTLAITSLLAEKIPVKRGS